MASYLIEEAIKSVWCDPNLDNQVRVAPARITKTHGDLLSSKIQDRIVNLPNKTSRFHVYVLGRATPKMVGLISSNPAWLVGDWVKISDAINKGPLFADIYTENGLHIPLFTGYYLYTRDGALVFALEIKNDFPVNLNTNRVYFRFYTNALYSSGKQFADGVYTATRGLKITNTDMISSMQTDVVKYRAKAGAVFCYINGKLAKDLSASNLKNGDYAEYIYDASVKLTPSIVVNSMPVFQSILDNKYKYLVHYPFTEAQHVINYQDDVDIYIVGKDIDGKEVGVYYHHNNEKSIRMVTHRDYAITVEFYEYLANSLADMLGNHPEIRNFELRLYVRDTGATRGLIYDNNRIFEMYKLNDSDIVNAMVGSHVGVEVWKAANLENSAYTKLMRVEYEEINQTLMEDAYGYNSLTRLLGDAPVKITNDAGYLSAKLPMGLYDYSTIYEYDANGVLLGSYRHVSGTQHMAQNSNAVLAEGLVGEGSQNAPAVYGTDNLQIPENYNYRVYMCYLVGGVPNNQWRDITDTPLYRVENNKLIWENLEFDQFLMVRHDKTYLDYEIELESIAGTFYFTLAEMANYGDGKKLHIAPVPGGDLDLFINGHPAIFGLDYVVRFPKIYITNKRFLKQPVDTEKQLIRVRVTGFCNKDLTFDAVEDVGFIEHGVLSNNSKFNIRDDKAMRIIVNGALRHRDDLIFSETHQGISVINALNGQPYLLSDIKVPFRGVTNKRTYDLREKALEIDADIEEYMSQYLPQPERNAPSAIQTRYPVVSPFICHIANDLFSGQFDKSRINKVLSDNEIIEICKEYEFLLDFDPITPSNNFDRKYTIIHPLSRLEGTPISMDLVSYRFLKRVVELYAGDLVDLGAFITITPV